MPTIKIDVMNKIARCADKRAFAVCGNSDYTISFNFDSEWDDYKAKTARFIYNGKYQDVAFVGTECAMPALYGVNSVFIGVYAGDIRTTTPAQLLMVRSIMDGKPKHDEPAADVYNQILALMEAGKIKGEQGEPGKDGKDGTNGTDGKDGADGYSPTAKVTATSTGATVTITDKTGTTTAEIKNGADGKDGTNGTNGKDGTNGTDGFSPVATVTQTSTGADISITDKNGTTSASITNGTDANVTKENVVSALGYTPLETAPVTSVNGKTGAVELAASDVGAISSANGSVQNAHLADSSVTTDKLAEGERMTSANITNALGKYELIESITVSDDTTTVIERTQEPDGTAYNFRKMIIKAAVAQASVASAQFSTVIGASVASAWSNNATSTTGTIYITQWLEVKNGIFNVRTHNGTTNSGYNTTDYGGSYSEAITSMESLIRIRMRLNSGALAFPSGTKIDIYAVRS